MDAVTAWPDLPYARWRETAATLQLGTQIVGKVRLTLTPWLNHGWQVPPYITARGLGTSPMPAGSEILEIELDFIDHRLVAWTSRGDKQSLVLEPQTVADFHRRVIHLLDGVGVALVINTCRTRLQTRSAFRRTASTLPTTAPPLIASGVR